MSMQTTQLKELPKGRADVIFRPLDDSWVLFDPRADQLHVLNLSAALVWTHLDGETSVEGIADAVGAAFTPPMAGSRAQADVEAVVERFRAAGLLESTARP
jgi:hypothetical protein